jgi:hypothetical protein
MITFYKELNFQPTFETLPFCEVSDLKHIPINSFVESAKNSSYYYCSVLFVQMMLLPL